MKTSIAHFPAAVALAQQYARLVVLSRLIMMSNSLHPKSRSQKKQSDAQVSLLTHQ